MQQPLVYHYRSGCNKNGWITVPHSLFKTEEGEIVDAEVVQSCFKKGPARSQVFKASNNLTNQNPLLVVAIANASIGKSKLIIKDLPEFAMYSPNCAIPSPTDPAYG